MHRFDDPALLAQCRRIKNMHAEIAGDPAHRDDYYARKHHHWELGAPLPSDELARWEEENQIELPVEYAYYLTQVGNGGACPGDRFSVFPPKPRPVDDFFRNDPIEVQRRVQKKYETEFRKFLESVRRPSEQLARVMSEEEWKETFGRHKMQEDGTLSLCAMDLTYIAYLIVTGPQRGRVVYLDWDGDCPPMWPKGGANFLDWIEGFYYDLTMGWTDAGWQFMWQEPGNADALIDAFRREKENDVYRQEVLYSFMKFGSLSEKAYKFLRSVRHPQFQPIIAKVLDHFHDD